MHFADKLLFTTINGDEDEAKQLEDEDNKDVIIESDDVQESDNDDNNENSEENVIILWNWFYKFVCKLILFYCLT